MNIKKCCAVVSMFVLSHVLSFGQGTLVIRLVITGAQLADANANPAPRVAFPARLGMTSDGKLLVVDSSDRNNNELFMVDITKTPPSFRRIVGSVEMRAKVDAANGPAPAPATVTVQSVDVDSDGDIIVLTDTGEPEKGFLFSIDPKTLAIKLLSGLDAPPGLSSVEGNRALAVSGTTAYITLNDRFGAVLGDAIVKIDTHAPDGGTTAATEFTSNAQLSAVISGDIDLNDIAVNPKTGNLIVINSGSPSSNDDILEIDIKTGAPSILVSATDIKADLKTADVGYSGVGADASGTIYLANRFGPSGDPTNQSIIAVKNPGKGVGDASMVASAAQIIAESSVVAADGKPPTDLRYQNSGLVVSGGEQGSPATVFVCTTTRRAGASADTAVGVISISRTS